MNVQSYRDLKVWQHGILLSKAVYLLTKAFPKEELFGLTSQARRAATSVPANIAEGYGRENTKEYIRFLRIAQGSLKETETHLILANEVGLANEQLTSPVLAICDELGRMLRSLIRKLQTRREE
jgi:four helix bundle protein